MFFCPTPPRPIADCANWRLGLHAAIGGLTEVGFTPNEDGLLVVSHDGRGLFDLASGQSSARDDEAPTTDCAWLDRAARQVRGLGASAGSWIRTVGLWGGALSTERVHVAADSGRWSVEVTGQGRRVQALLSLKQAAERQPQRWLIAQPVSEIRAFGFSPQGRWLVLATSADVLVFGSLG